MDTLAATGADAPSGEVGVDDVGVDLSGLPSFDRRALFKRFSRVAAPAAGLAAAACDIASGPFDRERHLLERATYGVTTAELDRIRSIGEAAWLSEQMNPASVDTSAVDALVAQLPAVGMTTTQLFTTYQGGGPTNAAFVQLAYASVIRQSMSPAQLFERMVEFWSDHFNVNGDEDQKLRLLKIVEDREAIRPNAMGTFADLLWASGTSPAMLLYLDNVTSSAGAINENYARELLELHAVGVGGGYTEDDIVELARLITGWRINTSNGQFYIDPAKHDSGPVTIMGWTRPASTDPLDAQAFFNWLAVQPATANFVCRKLAVRFVSDNPDPALVSAMASTWTANGSAIVPVLQTMFAHPAFDAAEEQKFNRPLDQLNATVRRMGGSWTPSTNVNQLAGIGGQLIGLGQVPFSWPAPNGYPDVEGAWRNVGSLIGRWNLTGELLAATSPLYSWDIAPFRAGLDGLTVQDICAAVIQRVLHRPDTALGRLALRYSVGWNDELVVPTGAEIDANLPALVFAALVSPDAQYR